MGNFLAQVKHVYVLWSRDLRAQNTTESACNKELHVIHKDVKVG